MVDGSGFCGVSSNGGLVDSVEVSRGDAADEARLLAGVQTSLFSALEEIQLWVGRLRDGSGGPLLVDEALSEIDRAVDQAVVVCDGQLSMLDGGLS